MSRNLVFAATATLTVLFGLALGFHQAGLPHTQRLANADDARIQDLNVISGALGGHYVLFHKLPQRLAELNRNGRVMRLADPETGTPYEYRVLGDNRFELCAIFATDSRAEPHPLPPARVHGAGRQCFDFPE